MTGNSQPVVWLPAVRAGSGADVFTMRLADALNRRGVSATVSWFPHWSELTPDLLYAARPPTGTNVIHANSAYAFAFRRKGIPLVATEHHYVLDPAYRPYKSMAQHLYHRILMGPYLRRSYARADAITTDSRFTADVLARLVNVKTTRTIPLWVDYDKFFPAPDPAKPHDQFKLLFVGNASRRKGADVISSLARRLGPAFEIRCTSGLRVDRRDDIAGNIRLLGRLTQDQLIQEYRTCDAVLVPSRYEGFGYSALEAMACGKPVIGFRCGAVDEVVVEGETGLLCDIDDLEVLVTHCMCLARDREVGKAMGQAGRARAITAFTETRAIDAYISIYRGLASDGANGDAKE